MAALSASQIDRAIGLARTARARGLASPLLLNLTAYGAEREGRDSDALVDLRQAHALAPDDIAVLNSLGLCLARLGQMPEAIGKFDEATRLAPEFAPGHYNKGWALEDIGEIDAAAQSYELAAAHSANPADALGRLASLMARRPDWAETRRLAGLALAADPQNAFATIAVASADLAEKDYSAAEGRLSKLLTHPEIGSLEQARASMLLGDVLDAQNRADDAFAAYTAGKNEMRRFYTARVGGPDTEAMPQRLARLTAYFTDASPGVWGHRSGDAPAEKPPTAAHIFLLGFPRSGTTLLEEVLACHPQVVTSGERDALAGPAHKYMSSAAGLDLLASGISLDAARNAYWSAVEAFGIDAGGKIFVDKLPYNTINLPLISRLFPAAKILFAIRDPRDVVLGCFRQLLQINPANFEFLTLDGTARFYDGVMRLAELYRAKLTLELLETRYEDIVEDFEAATRRVCEFAGMEWVPAMQDFAGRAKTRAIATPSASQIAQGLNRAGLERWRRYQTALAPVLPILKPWAERYGYPAT
ncbi:MAG TPA: sulfotransferase [Rhizomicrobium sp.]|jgi:tetratricopeptide (TPR) repeat protein|nr:sulfotransferase [Rhizomicrobium sp.]